VQSSALLILANKGMFGKIDFAIFADTGDEPQYVYDYLEKLKKLSDIPIKVCRTSEAGLSTDSLNKQFVKTPMFYGNKDNGSVILSSRHCTYDYKIKPINLAVKEMLGFKKGSHAKGRILVESLIGISIDESLRMKDSKIDWIVHSYPLVENRIDGHQCVKICMDAGLPEPKKSACFHCPYRSDSGWSELKRDHPEEFQRAVDWEKEIQKVKPGRFLHRSMRTLNNVGFDETGSLFDLDGFGNECEGMCGV